MRQWSDCHQAVDQKDVPRFQQNHERLQEAVRSPRLSFFVTLCVHPLKVLPRDSEKRFAKRILSQTTSHPVSCHTCNPATAISLPLCFHDCASLWSSLPTQYPQGLLKDMSNYATALHEAWQWLSMTGSYLPVLLFLSVMKSSGLGWTHFSSTYVVSFGHVTEVWLMKRRIENSFEPVLVPLSSLCCWLQ